VDSKKYFVIPYIRDISEIASQICNFGFIVGFRCLNKIDNFIRVHKDKTEHSFKKNIVYKIRCLDCNALYVEQTKKDS